ncbi:hypothetical protein P0C28_11290 [Aeromonas hydrophila]|uniref:hypothetical protein n=1 Tax=Aeromonas hydrophila TaxID=644 RepID=UPI0023AF7B7D|nr:hypothetical protein [Aeromonas hydrophila]MDE8809838.1 hypothetical protein [Aeromonas hydrophila]
MKIIGYIVLALLAFVIIANLMKPSEEELRARGEWLTTTCINEAKANNKFDYTQEMICRTAGTRIEKGEADLSDSGLSKFKNNLDWDGEPLKQ